MDLQQLVYFECIAKYENFSKASQILYVSQPSLSASVLRLEEELGAPLFDRKKGRIYLNSYGRYFLGVTQKILGLVDESKNSVWQESQTETKTRISIAGNGFNNTISDLIWKFQQRNPSVIIHSQFVNPLSPIEFSENDFIINRTHDTIPSYFHHMVLQRGEYHVVIPKTSPLSLQSCIRIQDLEHENFCFMTDDNKNYEPPHKYCLDAGFIPQCSFSTNDSFAKFRYLSKGTAAAFIPAGAVEMYSLIPDIVILPICKEDQKKYLMAHYHLYWSDAIYELPATTAFLEFIKNSIASSEEGGEIDIIR